MSPLWAYTPPPKHITLSPMSLPHCCCRYRSPSTRRSSHSGHSGKAGIRSVCPTPCITGKLQMVACLKRKCIQIIQACPFRASDVRDYPILVTDLPLLPSTSPTDLLSHISSSTRPTKTHDPSIHIYIL